MIYAYQSRTIVKSITVYNAAGAVITPGANDKIRVSIARSDNAAIPLIVVSGTPTVNGSSITTGAVQRVELMAADLQFEPGVYSLIVDYFDSADSAQWKQAGRDVFVLEATPAGD